MVVRNSRRWDIPHGGLEGDDHWRHGLLHLRGETSVVQLQPSRVRSRNIVSKVGSGDIPQDSGSIAYLMGCAVEQQGPKSAILKLPVAT